MPQEPLTFTEKNFTRGLITEATGLNFPDNAAIAASNTQFTLIGDVVRRLGINLESGFNDIDVTNISGCSSYVWNNPGGQPNKKVYVRQVDGNLLFYDISAATVGSPISQHSIGNIGLSSFVVVNGPLDVTAECQFADGNGYLFVYNTACEPFYVTYTNGVVTPTLIGVQVRDFIGDLDGLGIGTRPGGLSATHQYNLQNQGWVTGVPWSGTSSTSYAMETTGPFTFTIQTGLTIAGGTTVSIIWAGGNQWGIGTPGTVVASGPVTSYNSVTGALVINIIHIIPGSGSGANWILQPGASGTIGTFFTAAGGYPSNSDVWWYYKDSTGAYNPSATLNEITIATGQAPQGHYLLNPFIQDRSTVSGISGISVVQTDQRPTTGAWFQGRVWYAGINDSAAATGTTAFYSWTSNIYFSTIIETSADFGVCYQNNDPTSENLNGLLPTDGGVITIYEAGQIYKLFPIQNGMLVFAANGIWFITGSQGIGFKADDYTVTKISSVQILNACSFVDVLGLPYFWNEEGIYTVTPSQGGALTVEPITVGTILSFYNSIPFSSKKYARGAYDPINYVIQWTFRSTPETSPYDRYFFDSILNYNIYNKAFYPYTLSQGSSTNFINGVDYISYPFQNTNAPNPGFKYPCSFQSIGLSFVSFAEEYDPTFVDWGGANYTSTFTTGFRLRGQRTMMGTTIGQGMKRWQSPYTYVYSRGPNTNGYYLQSLWDYATTGLTSKWSVSQKVINLSNGTTGTFFRRHRLRGRGMACQLKFTSIDGMPFDIIGWGMYDTVNTGV
jgi:hypothetical protein